MRRVSGTRKRKYHPGCRSSYECVVHDVYTDVNKADNCMVININLKVYILQVVEINLDANELASQSRRT